MTDKEIFDCIEIKNANVVSNVERMIAGYTSSITMLITTENQNIKSSIDKLTDKVKTQNGSVRDLIIWKAEHCGEETGEEKTTKRHEVADALVLTKNRDNKFILFQVIALCLTLFMLFFAVYFGFRNNKKVNTIETTTNKTEQKVDNLGVPMETVTRGENKDTIRLFYFPNDDKRYRMIIERDTVKTK